MEDVLSVFKEPLSELRKKSTGEKYRADNGIWDDLPLTELPGYVGNKGILDGVIVTNNA